MTEQERRQRMIDDAERALMGMTGSPARRSTQDGGSGNSIDYSPDEVDTPDPLSTSASDVAPLDDFGSGIVDVSIWNPPAPETPQPLRPLDMPDMGVSESSFAPTFKIEPPDATGPLPPVSFDGLDDPSEKLSVPSRQSVDFDLQQRSEAVVNREFKLRDDQQDSMYRVGRDDQHEGPKIQDSMYRVGRDDQHEGPKIQFEPYRFSHHDTSHDREPEPRRLYPSDDAPEREPERVSFTAARVVTPAGTDKHLDVNPAAGGMRVVDHKDEFSDKAVELSVSILDLFSRLTANVMSLRQQLDELTQRIDSENDVEEFDGGQY